MKKLRIIATADWHADNDPKKQRKLEASLGQIVDYCKNNDVDVIIISGDVWEKKQSYSDKSGVPLVVTYLRQLSKLVDFIFITKGNNSHDEVGSIALLHQLEPNIYAYEYPVILGVKSPNVIQKPEITELLYELDADYEVIDNYDYLVTLVPYPTKSSFINEDSIDNNNTAFIEKFEQIFELIADKTASYDCPKILSFHGNVVGSRLSTGQTLVSQDIMVAPRTLQKAKHDYYALGHIHMRQEVAPNMVYSGSIYNKSWGETEQKSFEVVEFEIDENLEGFKMDTEKKYLDVAKPMVKIEAEFDKGAIIPEAEFEEYGYWDSVPPVGEYRIRIKVKENDRKLITDTTITELKERFGEDVKVEFNVVPDERDARSQEIMNAKTLCDEVIEYAKVIDFKIDNSILSKVAELEMDKTEVLNETT